MTEELSEHGPAGKKREFLRDGGKLIALEVVVLVVTVVVSAGGAFLVTRANLSSRIDDVERRLRVSRPTTEYVLRSTLYKQISDLRILEVQIAELNQSLAPWKRPKFTYSVGLPPGIPPFLQLPENIEWLDIRRVEEPAWLRGIDNRTLNKVVLDPQFGALEDKELVAALHLLALRVSTYNERIAAIIPAVAPANPVNWSMTPSIPHGASKTDVEAFLDFAERTISELRGLAAGMVERLRDSRVIIETVLTSTSDD